MSFEYLNCQFDMLFIFQYSRQVINVCKELPNVKYARTPGKVLWDTSIVIFSLQNTGKRARLGNQAMFPKDTYKKFILTINVSQESRCRYVCQRFGYETLV